MQDTSSKLGWYWHRLRAMSFDELRLRLRKKAYQRADAHYLPPPKMELEPSGSFPLLPPKGDAPSELIEALRRDLPQILSGKWNAFGHLPIKVDDPPKWQFDYLVRKDCHSNTSAFKLDHRAQQGGADIKIIWEPSRWNQLVRLAMAAYVLGDDHAGQKCVEWLFSWCKSNRPFTGLNWTSGLETGLRLVQFTWIDALLTESGVPEKSLNELRNQILPPHVWYTSRHRSFGSSANNHLIGELAGLIVSVARWPELTSFTESLRELNHVFESEILAQFAADGGNQEQALGYHLFSWEFCWQALNALKSSGIVVSTQVQDRLRLAGEFYSEVKPAGDPWDYGDSDNAYVTPLFADESHAAREWGTWFRSSPESRSLEYWWGDFPCLNSIPHQDGWRVFSDSGYAVFNRDDWFLRWDFSALGYLSMAPHGHLDALHLSLWCGEEPIIIDPGTGAYYADKNLRNHLADWSSHNGAHFSGDFPKRRGTFLWGEHHARPEFHLIDSARAEANLRLPAGRIKRTINVLANGFRVTDEIESNAGVQGVNSTWKFGPHIQLRTDPITLTSGDDRFNISLSGWEMVSACNPEQRYRNKIARTSAELNQVPFDSLVSPAFRAVTVAPYVKLRSSGTGSCSLEITRA